jgi:hypothetical protein
MGDNSILTQTSPEELWKHLIVWPLNASCSFKVLDRESSFKPEYIIPQLVLQIVRNEQKWDGIRFSSTHIDLHEMKTAKGHFYNYVIPVKENKDEGYCDKLTNMFEMTHVIPWQIEHVFAKEQGTFIYGADETPYNVSAIELISRQTLAYQYSVFGNLENKLFVMSTNKIKTI